jgi:magnesium-protoporphyrin IX monomethyl ester (oxidative) cyclase
LGISCHATFVLGFPGESVEDIKESFRYASYCDFDSASFFIVSPLPGSELYDVCREKGFLTDTSFDRLDFKSTKINNPDLSPELLEELVKNENTYFILRYLFKHPVKFFKKYGRFMLASPKNIPKVFGRVT